MHLRSSSTHWVLHMKAEVIHDSEQNVTQQHADSIEILLVDTSETIKCRKYIILQFILSTTLNRNKSPTFVFNEKKGSYFRIKGHKENFQTIISILCHLILPSRQFFLRYGTTVKGLCLFFFLFLCYCLVSSTS